MSRRAAVFRKNGLSAHFREYRRRLTMDYLFINARVLTPFAFRDAAVLVRGGRIEEIAGHIEPA